MKEFEHAIGALWHPVFFGEAKRRTKHENPLWAHSDYTRCSHVSVQRINYFQRLGQPLESVDRFLLAPPISVGSSIWSDEGIT
jgi:hypothetical protein